MKWFLGYVVCNLIGAFVTHWWSMYLRNHLEKQRSETDPHAPPTNTWLALLTGIIERIIYTTLIAFDISGSGAFIGSWVFIKAVGGWAKWGKEYSEYGKSLFMRGLLGSAMSVIFGVIGGIIIAKWS